MSVKRHFYFRNQFITSCFLVLSGFSVWAQPVFNTNFSPDTIGPGSISTLTFNIDNSASGTPVTDMAFTNNLPTGVIIATPAQAFSECVNGLVVAPEGGNTITFTEGRLSAGASCTVSVDVTSSTAGTTTNTSGDLTSSAGNSGTASDDLTVDLGRPGFSKSFSPNNVNFGDRSTLTFTLDNTMNTNDTITFTFVDNLPIGMVVADPSGLITDCPQNVNSQLNATPGSSQINYNYFGQTFIGDPTLQSGSICTISVDVMANARGELNNTTSELTNNSGGATVSSGKAGDVLVVNSIGDIQLTQSFLEDPVTPGSQVELQFKLSSLNRNFDITDIDFTDDLDATLSGLVATGLPLNGVCGAGSQLSGSSVLTLTGANLSPEASCSFSVMLTVPAGAASGAYINTTSQATGQITGQPTNGNASTDTLFVNLAPELSKTFAPDSIQAGEDTTMVFTITNSSTTDAVTDISFDDNLAAFLSGAQFAALPAAGFCGAGSTAGTFSQSGQLFLTINNASLAASDSCSFNVNISTAANTPPGAYTNTTEPVMATIAGQTYIGKTASDDLTIEDLPQLSMLFTDDPVVPGQTVTVQYRISAAQEGSLSATDMTFTHDLDATLSGLVAVGLPLNDVCGTGSQISGTNLLTLSDASINSGTPCEFTVDVQVPAAAGSGTYPSTTSVLSSTVSGQPITSPAAADDLQVGALAFTKQFIDDPSIPGNTVTLEYTIENLSPTDDATDMFFNHNLSAVFSGLTANPPLPVNPCGAGSSITGTTFLILTGGNLAAGASCTFDVTLQIPAATANGQYGSITSSLTATVDGSPTVFDPASDVLTTNNNLIFFSKSYLNNPVSPGGTASLEFTLTNGSSTDDIMDITFTDDLDASLSGLTAVSLPASDVCGAGSSISGTSTLTLTGGNLLSGATCTFNVDVVVPGGASSGVYTNTTSEATGTINGLAVMGDPAIDDLLVGFVQFNKAFAGPVDTGDTTTLTFTLTNGDPNAQNSLAFTDDLDAVLSGLVAVGLPINDVCGAGSQISGTSFLSFTGGQLAPTGGMCSFDVTVQVPSGLIDSTYTNVTSELFQSGLPITEPATAELQVNGVPLIDLSVTSIDFGSIEVGNSTAVQTTTVTNTGTADLTISNIDTVTSPFNLNGSSTCPATPIILTPGANCTLVFDFTPTAAGIANLTIDLTSDAQGTPQTSVQLQGNGLQALSVINPNPVDFGITELNTNSLVTTVTLSNNGTADLDVSNITAASGDFALTGGSCGAAPFILLPMANCTLNYQFSPSSVGAQSQNITFTSDSSTSPDTLLLQGEGVQAELTLSANSVTFPNTTVNMTSSEQLITITNTGLIELRVTAITAANAPFSLSGGSCSALPVVLAVNASCTLGYQFAPTATGNFNQTISLSSNAFSSPDTFDLLGNGIEPGLQLSDAVLDFQSVDVNTNSQALSLTVSNTGGADLVIDNITVPTSPFNRTGGSCGNTPLTLLTNESCTLTYQFIPTTAGNFTQSIQVQSNASTSPDSFDLTGIGVEIILNISDDSVAFDFTAANEVQTQTLTLTSAGADEVIITDISQPTAPFSIDFTDCGALPITLSGGASCELVISYTTETTANNSSFLITSNDPDSPLEIILSGSGLLEPVFVPVLGSFGLWIMLALMLLVANGYILKRRRKKI